MQKIYKYQLSITGMQKLSIPLVKVLDIQVQNGHHFLWAIIDDNEPIHNMIVRCFGTGHEIDKEDAKAYVSTTQLNGFVWHWSVKLGKKE